MVMAFANGSKAGLDQLLHGWVEIAVLQRAFKLRLDMIFAALDLGNDRRIVASPVSASRKPRNARCARRARCHRPRDAAQFRGLLLKNVDDRLALVGAARKMSRNCAALALRRPAIAIDTVERGGDNELTRADIRVVKHLKSFRENSGQASCDSFTHPTSADPQSCVGLALAPHFIEPFSRTHHKTGHFGALRLRGAQPDT